MYIKDFKISILPITETALPEIYQSYKSNETIVIH